MTDEIKKIKIHTLGDRAHFAAVTAASLGLGAWVFTESPLATSYKIGTLALSTIAMWGIKKWADSHMARKIEADTYPLTPETLSFSEIISNITPFLTGTNHQSNDAFKDFEKIAKSLGLSKLPEMRGKKKQMKALVRAYENFIQTIRNEAGLKPDEEKDIIVKFSLQQLQDKFYNHLREEAKKLGVKEQEMFYSQATAKNIPNKEQYTTLSEQALGGTTSQERLGVVAHEFGHLAANHAQESNTHTITKTATMALGIVSLCSTAPSSPFTHYIGVAVATTFALVANQILSTHLQKHHEYQADRLALEATGTNGMKDYLSSTIYEGEKKPIWKRVLSYPIDIIKDIAFTSHPSTEKRIARLKKMAAKMPASNPIAPTP